METDERLARPRNTSQEANGAESFSSRLAGDGNQGVLRLCRVVRSCMADFTNIVSSKQSLSFLNHRPRRVSLGRIPSHHVQRMPAKGVQPRVDGKKRIGERVRVRGQHVEYDAVLILEAGCEFDGLRR